MRQFLAAFLRIFGFIFIGHQLREQLSHLAGLCCHNVIEDDWRILKIIILHQTFMNTVLTHSYEILLSSSGSGQDLAQALAQALSGSLRLSQALTL